MRIAGRVKHIVIGLAVLAPGWLASCSDSARQALPDGGIVVVPDGDGGVDATLRCSVSALQGKKGVHSVRGAVEAPILNGLPSQRLMANALLTNPKANQALIDNPLSSASFDIDGCVTRDESCPGWQLRDPFAQDFMKTLIECALEPGAGVSWTDPATNAEITWEGDLGFCPAWAASNIAGDIQCQELVSACVLARNNAFGSRVVLSMRGLVQGDEAIPLAARMPGDRAPGVQSFDDCPATVPGQPVDRDCGWEQSLVGVCQAGTTVELGGTPSCAGDMMIRVCDDLGACDSASAVIGDEQACSADQPGSDLSFPCSESNLFTVMTAPVQPGGTGEITPAVQTAAAFPVPERELFSWPEGAYYGTLFGPGAITPRFSVVVDENGHVTYELDGEQHTRYNTDCNSNPDGGLATREHWNQEFLFGAIAAVGTDVAVYTKAYACWSPGWNLEDAYTRERLCAGEQSSKLCAATAVAECWNGDPATSLCQVQDAAAPGDRDYDNCQDPEGGIWANPLTVFLDEPCALFPDGPGRDRCLIDYVRPGGEIAQIISSTQHTCAVMRSGQMRCFGRNSWGQLGYGDTEIIGDDELAREAGDIALADQVAQAAVGRVHTCAMFRDRRTITCWGDNSQGELGFAADAAPHNSPADSQPIALPPEIAGEIAQIAMGTSHGCLLVESDGAVHCWGDDANGRLGYGIDDHDVPPATPVLTGVTSLALSTHSCALTQAGAVHCWGWNNAGQLGHGDRVDRDVPGTALVIDPGTAATGIAASVFHTCVSLASGGARCWGENGNGQLGIGSTADVVDSSLSVELSFASPITKLAAGYAHTCALLENGNVHCWGDNSKGQLGHLSTLPSFDSIGDDELATDIGPVPLGRPAVDITVGWHHTCAILDNGLVRCFGRNDTFGILGQGNSATELDTANKWAIEQGNLPLQ